MESRQFLATGAFCTRAANSAIGEGAGASNDEKEGVYERNLLASFRPTLVLLLLRFGLDEPVFRGLDEPVFRK